ncbi:AzlC family ABC transporter permease [Cypionkella sp.]|uniref:AzlC family ABC transporter permease n=1 Tax=Cypionkella sp. TaxID=2811411 RepID=UPI0037502A35
MPSSFYTVKGLSPSASGVKQRGSGLGRQGFWRGVVDALPFVVVIVPFAMLFGLLASEAGLHLYEIILFSVVVFAGASQFAALALLKDHAPVLIVLVTALAVNLRMLMYSVALAPHLGAARARTRAFIAYFLVDQSFALAMQDYEKRPAQSLAEKLGYFFGAVTPIVPVWTISTIAGALVGRSIPAGYALDFAVPITFLAMTAPMLRTRAHWVAAVVSVGLVLGLRAMPYGTGLLVAAAAGMVAGAAMETWAARGKHD